MSNTVEETKIKRGQQLLDFIQQELSGYAPSLVGKLTTYIMVRQNLKSNMDEEEVTKILDQRENDINNVIERRVGHNHNLVDRKDETVPYEKGAFQGLANLRKV